MRRELTNFRIDSELADGLRQVKDRDGIPIAEQIRRAIRLWLKTKKVKLGPPADGRARKTKK